ncbi:MAG: dihydrofolate reductase family protein [Solobacterium sp.]|jgi:2,5-diamino-6-(ribosylamino)-4(3H)-pyrimidinone 5'-phosphate reductase|nr:dihydrofolate reductase family protein [Solobacterium sp.]MCH4227747.1 dihydrofolate reductase family protein [Solobacterium sp.]
MLMSADGKISTGDNDSLDMDQDFPKIDGIKEGLHQYYEIEETTDLWSFNTGRVQAKVGANERNLSDHHWNVSFVILDNHHLNEHGIEYFCSISKNFVLFTSKFDHPAYRVNQENLHIEHYDSLNLKKMLETLKEKYGCAKLTVQSGGTLNSLFLREHLFDYADLVVAPVLVGGKDTSSLIDGESLHRTDQMSDLGVLKLIEAEPLKDSYLRLHYQIMNAEND